jgi:fatty acid desaturase
MTIPGRLNIVIAVAACGAALWLLWLASHASSGWLLAAAAIAFSYVGNTIFSLLHESVHGIFHPRRALNDAFGVLGAAFFPTSFHLQRVVHFGHHRRNRTDHELFDHFTPGENRWRKRFHLYCLLTGFFWMSAPLGCALFLVAPLFRSRVFKEGVARFYGFEPMVADLLRAPGRTIRLEILFTLAFQAAIAWALDLSLLGWCACYGAFALNWCSLQYTDHAWTARDIRNGASNLRVNRVVQWIFLNYHHHLAHHQNPTVPWIHLHRLVDWSAPRPSYLANYLKLWRGPTPTDEPAPATPERQPELLAR